MTEPSLKQGLLPLVPMEGAASMLEAVVQRTFLPRGLMLWDVGTAQLELILIGTDVQLISSWGPIPARWFTVAQNFEAVARAIAEGKEPPAWGTWRPVLCGQRLRLRFDQPAMKFQSLIWGEYFD